MLISIKTIKNFFSKIDYPDNLINGCWTWTASTGLNGYGQFHVQRKHISAHRFSYVLFSGKIPKGKILLHSCDQPSCVNPFHLKPGTHKDNTQDMLSKGRSNPAFGENSGRAKLTDKQIQEIRAKYKPGKNQWDKDSYPIVKLAKEYGAGPATIHSIILGKTRVQ